MTRKVLNTTLAVNDNPLAALLRYSEPGGIERSERAGQQQLVASEVLPIDTRGDDAGFIALGFTFGEADPNDPLFRPATLPDGWKREGSDHAMWSYIVDQRGIRRVSVFYKAAYYDRNAAMHINNVGNQVGTDALYGDEIPTAESMRLALLTEDEMDEVRGAMGRMRSKIAETPDIYGKYAAKLAACDAIIPGI